MSSSPQIQSSPTSSASSPPAPIYERFSRLSYFSQSEDSSSSAGSFTTATAGAPHSPALSLSTNFQLPTPQRQDSAPNSPFVTSPGSFYQATFGSDSPSASPSLGAGSWTRTPSPPKQQQPAQPRQRDTPTSPTERTNPRRISVLGSLIRKKAPSGSTSSSSTRASSPLGARSAVLPSATSGPRLSPLTFDGEATSDQPKLDTVDEMRFTRGSNRPSRDAQPVQAQDSPQLKDGSARAPHARPAVTPIAQLHSSAHMATSDRAPAVPDKPTQVNHPSPNGARAPGAASALPSGERVLPSAASPVQTQQARANPFEAASISRSTSYQQQQQQNIRTTRQPSSSDHSSSDANKDSSDDLHRQDSATSGSAPATPIDDSVEWTPLANKQFNSSSMTTPTSSLPPGARASTYSPSASLTSSPSQSYTAHSPAVQNSLSASTGYSPLAAFFGGATSPPPRPTQVYASPPSTVQSSPANGSPIRQTQTQAQRSEQPAPVKRTLTYSRSGVPLPPGYGDDDDEEDPYAEFAKRKQAQGQTLQQSVLPTPVATPPRRTATSPRSPSSEGASSSRPKVATAPAETSKNTVSPRLRTKNSFFVADESPVTPTAPVPALPATPRVNEVAAAIQAAEAARSPASVPAPVPRSGPPTPKKDGKEFAPRPAESPKVAEPRPAPAAAVHSRIPISPQAKTSKTLPPAPVQERSPRQFQQESPALQQRKPSVPHLRAAALAQAVQREQAANQANELKHAPALAPAVAPAQVRFAAPTEAVRGEVNEVVGDADGEVEPEEAAPLAPRFEHALTAFPTTILVNILSLIEYDDFRSLRVVSKTLARSFDGFAREIVLQRFLGPLGYRTLNPAVPSQGQVVSRSGGSMHQPNGRAQVVSRRTGAASDNGHSSPSERNLSTTVAPAARADAGAAGGIALTLRDLDGFLAGMELELLEYGKMARQDSAGQLHPAMARLARASTRAFNRVVLRLRAQSEIPREGGGGRPPFYFRSLPKSREVVYKLGRAPMLRVWVPTARGSSWMGDEEVVECEREIWRAGVWNLLRRGDLVRNVALGDFANEGKLISDGKYLRDLEYKFDVVGHLPSWIDMLGFAPGYYHNQIAASESNPVFYLSLRNFAGPIRDSLLLCTDKVQVSSPQGNYTVKRFVYRGATKIKPGTIIGNGGGAGGFGPGGLIVADDGWSGQVVVETDGTTEHATMLLNRCESKVATPWKILREKSRPNCIWLRPVTDDEAI